MKSLNLSWRADGAFRCARVSLAALAMAALAGGCAATDPGPSRVAGPISAYPGDAPAPPPIQAAKVEIEADGLPAQLAPRHRRPVKDDPTEPWSPNYGSARADAADTAPAPAKVSAVAASHQAAPVATQAVASKIDADDIIRQAIAAHEMRQR
ncbi:MAG: hypothetical protein R3D44_03295 [Hyphomicrobiaceae bacterium]